MSSRPPQRAPWRTLTVALVTAVATMLAPVIPAYADDITAPLAPPAAVSEQPADAPAADEAEPEAAPEEQPDSPSMQSFSAPALEPMSTPAFAPASIVEYGIAVTPTTGVESGDVLTVTGTLPAELAKTAGGTQPTSIYLWLCAQPEGSTVGTAGGRASNSGGSTLCGPSPLSIAPVAVPSAGIMTGTGSVTDGVWTFSVPFTVPADAIGGAECTTSTVDGLDCAVFTRLNHLFNAGNTADPYQLDQYVPLTFAPDYGISVSPTAGVESGDVLTVTGTLPAELAKTTGGTQPTSIYLWLCAQPEGSTVGTAGGRASNSGGSTLCGPSPLSIAPVAVPSAGIMTGTGSVTDGVWTFSVPFTIPADAIGGAECTTSLADGLDCAVFTRLNHLFNAGNTANPYQLDQYVPLTFAAAAAPVSTAVGISASKTTGLTVGETVTATATVSPTAAAGVVQLLLDGTVIATGPAGTPLVAATAALTAGSHTLLAKFVPTDASAFAPSSSPALSLAVSAPVPGAGSFSWGGYSEFNSYVTGPISRGAIIASGGAASNGSGFTWPQTSGGSFDTATGIGTVNYRGVVRFTGHEGSLDIAMSNPVIRVDSAASATLLVTTGGSQVAFASLDLGAATRSAGADGSVTYSAVPVRLLAGGAAFYDGRYPVGTRVNSASFVIGSASTAADAPARTVSAAAVTPSREPAATPPSTDGLQVDPEGGSFVEGGDLTATASGFQPNESGILVVIYSEPTVLARDLTADANGVATWDGRLPAGLTGTHTLTFQGSVSRGMVIDIAALEIGTCTIDGASFEWGFKESFRSYLDSAIAHGAWTVSEGAVYNTPVFGFENGSGTFDPAATAGRIAFPGAITFTGHEGVLNTTVSNPVFTFVDEKTAMLTVDVNGETRDGESVAADGVEFVSLDLSAATISQDGSVVTIADIPTVLTEAGNSAFGTYPAGEEFDPITITITTGDDCDVAAAPAPTESGTTPLDGAPMSAMDLTWLWWLIGALVLIGAVVAIVLGVRRRSAS